MAKNKPIRVKVVPAAEPSHEQLGEVAEKLFQILAEERARKREAASERPKTHTAA
jgi:hypothetical protein